MCVYLVGVVRVPVLLGEERGQGDALGERHHADDDGLRQIDARRRQARERGRRQSGGNVGKYCT